MNADLIARAEAIFLAAVKLPFSDRSKFLDQECSNNTELRSWVERLLSHDKNGMTGFLATPHYIADNELTQPHVDGTWVDRFLIVRKIGQGGMGQVYLAQQQEPKRNVALKILRSDLSSHSHASHFKQEIEVLGRLNHPGIAQIHDAGTTEEGNPYFAMEYVPGKPLTEFVKHKNLVSSEKLELVIQICHAVNYANERGIIHRDLKPPNILVVDHGQGNYQAKILDFGVAHLTRDLDQQRARKTMPGQLLGTLAYMSPEQASCKNQIIKPSSDVYQLGVILYEMLTGKLPLQVVGESFPEALRKIIEDDPPCLGADDDSLDGDLQFIVAKALAKEPERRYTAAVDLALDIQRFLSLKPIKARLTTLFYLMRKKFQRRRGSAIVLFAIVLISLAALVFSLKGGP